MSNAAAESVGASELLVAVRRDAVSVTLDESVVLSVAGTDEDTFAASTALATCADKRVVAAD